jgi:hypothetical protein
LYFFTASPSQSHELLFLRASGTNLVIAYLL